jgi:hypothetical protein
MSFPQILEVAIGLAVVYYILGAIVSYITQVINEAAETRGKSLEGYLKKIVGDKYVDLKELPQIKALRPIRYKNFLSIFGSVTEPKMLEKIPAPMLVDAFFDLTGLSGKEGLNVDELTAAISQLPESEGKQAILKWINQGVTDVNELRDRATAYFTGILEQASATFKANARSFVIILSLLITLLFGTDSIQLARDLWNNAELRAVAVAQANAVVQEQGAEADLDQLIDELKAHSIQFGWWQTQSLPQNGSAGTWALFILLKALGLGLTTLAVSQGSSFWYDLLKRLTGGGGNKESGEAQG